MQVRSTRRPCPVIEISSLEQRLLFCSYHDSFGSHIGTYPGIHAPRNSGGTSGGGSTQRSTGVSLIVPTLNSLSGAAATLYLDFDGDVARTWGSYNVTTTKAYDIDGDPTTFSAQELANINEIFQRVAEKFSLFNINVTTADPGDLVDGHSMKVVIGGDGAWTSSAPGGISYVGSFSNSAPNIAYAFSDNLGGGYAKYVAEAICHESGHAFGLQHQSTYNGLTKLQEYNPGTSSSAPTMGNSYTAARGLWWYGQSSTGGMQDDIAIIAGAANGFGFRRDEYGNSMTSARLTSFSNGKFVMKGLIGTTSDRDFFKINFSGGQLQLKLRALMAGAMLDAKLRIYRADGTTVVATDGAGLGETLTRTLAAGTYYAAIFSHGSYGDVGQYQLYGYQTSTASATARSAPPPASIFSVKPITAETGADQTLDLTSA